ncbi:MAG: NUDIX domain-containing protein [Candidatus Aenigmarchaeota archaeon]|nr:NUDIX domain-containing protein [Candidatus Aenigmarchaeota archaeon]
MEIVRHDTTALVAMKGGKFLLIKRGHSPEKGFWAFPGGHVDKGETPYRCMRREAKEEVGDFKIEKRPFFVFVHDAGILHRHRCHAFHGKPEGNVRAGSDAAELGWFSLKGMEKLDVTHYTKKILNHMIEKGII